MAPRARLGEAKARATASLSFFDVRAPHARRHFLQVPLMDHKTGIEDEVGDWFAVAFVEQRLNGSLRFEIDVLHAGRVEISIHEHAVSGCVAVEATENHVA